MRNPNHAAMIAILTAHAEGKQLQSRRNGSQNDFNDVGSPTFDFSDWEYRIKVVPPAPVERFAIVFDNEPGRNIFSFSNEIAARNALSTERSRAGGRVVCLREVR